MSRIVFVTGTTGFIGSDLVTKLVNDCKVIATVRRQSKILPPDINQVLVKDLYSDSYSLSGYDKIDAVIHLAARAHIFTENSDDPLSDFRKANVEVTKKLARQAVDAGVKRFIFISTIGVNGKQNQKPYTERDQPKPHNDYAISKCEAEQYLLALAKKTDMEVVIIRPPLVYGPNAPGNFGSLMKWMNKGIPLPFGAIDNQRSLVALDNLVSFIIHCMDHPKAANEIFLISDGEDVSTTELLRKVAKALDKKSRLVPVPVSWMQFVAKLLGKEEVANRLFGSLQVDSSKARELLGWKPVITMDEQLKKTAEAFQKQY